jgi:hypothetical protein
MKIMINAVFIVHKNTRKSQCGARVMYDCSLGMKEVELFGGAAKCMLPPDWLDASSFRDVPDHQEVFIHPTAKGEQSVIIEILEYEAKITDCEAGTYYFNDLANADGASSSTIDENIASLSEREIFGQGVTVISISGVQVKGKLGPESPTVPVVVLMSLIRAPHIHSDILVTCHSFPEFASEIHVIHNSVMGTLRFVDEGLFA